MAQKTKIGISTCPNDTFAFHGLLTGKVKSEIDFEFELHDVQVLNDKLIAGEFDIAKASFHTALLLSDELGVLDAGSALGYGVGPLLLASQDNQPVRNSDQPTDDCGVQRVLCPGKFTTASLLYQLFYPDCGQIENVIFSEIMPALKNHSADFGVCIHEGRFTWQEEGLFKVSDLGEKWESLTSQPLPLGGILARHQLGKSIHEKVNQAIRDSIEYGWKYRQETAATMSKYAQEFSEDVLFSHVDLYVNEWTASLGSVGEKALAMLHQKGVEVGLIKPNQRKLENRWPQNLVTASSLNRPPNNFGGRFLCHSHGATAAQSGAIPFESKFPARVSPQNRTRPEKL